MVSVWCLVVSVLLTGFAACIVIHFTGRWAWDDGYEAGRLETLSRLATILEGLVDAESSAPGE